MGDKQEPRAFIALSPALFLGVLGVVLYVPAGMAFAAPGSYESNPDMRTLVMMIHGSIPVAAVSVLVSVTLARFVWEKCLWLNWAVVVGYLAVMAYWAVRAGVGW